MNQTQTIERHSSSSDDQEIGMMEILIVLAKYKKRIAGITLGAALLSLAFSYVLPSEFEATTKVLPPQPQSSAASLLSQLGGIAGAAAAGVANIKNPNDLYIGMLKSRTVADRLISQFNLKNVYGTDSMDRARKRLEANTNITSGKDGLITIVVEDREKKLVAPLANAYVAELFRLMKTLAVTDASQRRLFYERQLDATKDNLAKAEMALKGAMAAKGVTSVDSESRAIIETVARLRAQASAKEIQLTSLRAFLTPSNPEYRRAEVELESLRGELARLENGRGGDPNAVGSPGGLENVKLLRDLKYQQMLYEALAKQYEVARIDEAKDPAMIQILDQAVEPEQKVRPRRSVIIILSTTFALLSAVFWAFLSESRQKALLTPQGSARWHELKSHLGLRTKGRG